MDINGKDLPTKYGVNQTEEFCEIKGMSLKEYFTLFSNEEGNTFGNIRLLIWTALKDGARQAGNEFTLTVYDVGDAMDSDPAGYIKEALTELTGSLPKPVENGGAKKEGPSPSIQDVKDLCSEMGMTYDEMLSCTWKQYDYMQRGHLRRVERLWDVGRHLMATMFNSSGFSRKAVKAQDIMKLPLLDGYGRSKTVKAEKMDKDDVNKLLDVLNKT